MNGYVLDTNVVSELMRDDPGPMVLAFLLEKRGLWLTTVTIHELEYGLRLLPQGRRRSVHETKLARLVADYGDCILAVDCAAAEHAARLRVQARRSGRVMHLADALIAGCARANGLGVATRNVTDFEGLGVEVANPWEPLEFRHAVVQTAVLLARPDSS